jgi:polysaccharide export outer membrane protein
MPIWIWRYLGEETMVELRSSWLFSVILAFVFCSSQLGCGRSAERTVVKKAVPPTRPVAGSVELVKQNLSMASELMKIPQTEYVLGSEDTIKVNVFRHDELAIEAKIGPTGKISDYLIGDIQAGGLTQFELRDRFQEELSRFIKDPKVVVSIIEFRSHKIYVLGQVKSPGIYRMRSNFSLLEAMASAGGLTPYADLQGAYVVRDGRIVLVNFYELISKGKMEENIPLLQEDLVFIPDNRDHKVFVLGEVNKQAAVPVGERLTLLEAIAEAGGFTRDASKGSVVVMRGNLSEPEIMKIDAERVEFVHDIPLQRGDIVYVPSTGFASVERVAMRLSHILEPLYRLTRTIVWGDAAVRILEGQESKLVWPEE